MTLTTYLRYYDQADREVRGPHANLIGNPVGLTGDCSNITGDCSRIHGDVTHATGDVTGLIGSFSVHNGESTFIGQVDLSFATLEVRKASKDKSANTTNKPNPKLYNFTHYLENNAACPKLPASLPSEPYVCVHNGLPGDQVHHVIQKYTLNYWRNFNFKTSTVHTERIRIDPNSLSVLVYYMLTFEPVLIPGDGEDLYPETFTLVVMSPNFWLKHSNHPIVCPVCNIRAFFIINALTGQMHLTCRHTI